MKIVTASLLLVCAICLLAASSGQAAEKIYFGLSDKGDVSSFQKEETLLQRKVPLIQTFHPWGNSLRQAAPRWDELRARPVLHISTRGDDGEIITPRQIAMGKGDDYLVDLNKEAYDWKKRIIIRPLGEPNRPINLYSPFLENGKPRGRDYKAKYYRQAFRRIAVILRGGKVDRILARLRMPPLGLTLSRPNIEILWSPLPSSLGILGNGPGYFWPGAKYMNWVGTSLFEEWVTWRDINKFYQKWSPDKKFMFPEWGGVNTQDKFLSKSVSWCKRKSRCFALLYYRGFNDQFEIAPGARRSLKSLLSPRRFPFFAPEHKTDDF